MADVERYVDRLLEIDKKTKELQSAIAEVGGWGLTELVGSFRSIFNRLCPFKVGDRVELTYTPDITSKKGWGWMSSKHFLVKGSPGVISGRGYRQNTERFSFEVKFDLDSWMPSYPLNNEDLVQPLSDGQSLYTFFEGTLCLTEKPEALWKDIYEGAKAPPWVFDIAEAGGWGEYAHKVAAERITRGK